MEKKDRTELQEQRDQFTVVLEDIQSHNRVFGELLLSVKEDVDMLKGKVDGLETRFGGLEMRFDGLESKVDTMQEKLDATFEEVGRLREDVTEMNNNKADKSVVTDLSNRVGRLELAR